MEEKGSSRGNSDDINVKLQLSTQMLLSHSLTHWMLLKHHGDKPYTRTCKEVRILE